MDKYISHLHIIESDGCNSLFYFYSYVIYFLIYFRPYELWSKCESRFNFGVGLYEFL
jgi:hypothetical protein